MSAPTQAPPNISEPVAAQFLHNLSERQIDHLHYAIPPTNEPERFSQFLEAPRRTPLPAKFIFPALRDPSRLAHKEITIEKDKVESDEKNHGGRSRSSSTNSVTSIDVKKEIQKVKVIVDVLDWRFYSTSACLCLLNLVAAWDATSLAVVLPVRGSFLPRDMPFDLFCKRL